MAERQCLFFETEGLSEDQKNFVLHAMQVIHKPEGWDVADHGISVYASNSFDGQRFTDALMIAMAQYMEQQNCDYELKATYSYSYHYTETYIVKKNSVVMTEWAEWFPDPELISEGCACVDLIAERHAKSIRVWPSPEIHAEE